MCGEIGTASYGSHLGNRHVAAKKHIITEQFDKCGLILLTCISKHHIKIVIISKSIIID